ncbi:MAG: carbohydrate binding family 9 domain-containing protein [Candidatus Eisenbacteria sp.]|nr:carbohydrate binding family 9 domain-containing protein [Candidatus Eisenbacteria bacterium]
MAIESVRTIHPPRIDGRLDDPVWQTAPVWREFVAFHPEPGASPSQPTAVRIVHDSEAIYLAYRCFDDQPGSIRAALAPRDQAFADDWVGLILDPFGDGRSAVQLLVNPSGCQLDARIPGDGSGDDFSVDYCFASATARDSSGWSAELAIPFASLRYQAGDPIEMGLFALRHVSRTGERLAMPPIQLGDSHWLARGLRVRFAGVAEGPPVDLLPALTWRAHAGRGLDGVWSERDDQAQLGGSLHWALTHHLVLSAAYEPDFSQVEADAPQVEVNQRFPIYYPEKRPFFLEGREFFCMSAEGGALGAIFHSRTIEQPRWGAKLSGRIGRRHALGLLVARDAPGDLSGAAGGAEGNGSPGTGASAELPEARILVARYAHVLSPTATVGGYADLRETAAGTGSGDKRTATMGLDADLLLGASVRLAGHWLHSREQAEEEGPDGHAWTLRLQRPRERSFLQLRWQAVSPSFVLGNGYLQRRGIREARLDLETRLFPDVRGIERLIPWLSANGAWAWGGRRTDRGVTLALRAEGQRQSALEVARRWSEEFFAGLTMATHAWTIQASTQWIAGVQLQAITRWERVPFYDPYAPAPGCARTIAAAVTLQPTEHWETALETTILRFRLEEAKASLYDDAILSARIRWQPSRYLFFRAIGEWNGFAGELLTDWLASFRYVPGTVVHVGLGNLYRYEEEGRALSSNLIRRKYERQRELFLKIAYGFHF